MLLDGIIYCCQRGRRLKFMTDEDDVWSEAVKGVKHFTTNRYVEDVKPKDVEIRRNKITTVTFDVLKAGKSVSKDDFSQMDGNLAKRFKREEFKPEAVLDLHGVTEKDAFEKVCEFIKTAYKNRKRCVLIVTGKGYDEAIFSERGVLRKSVPGWLSKSEISSFILAFKNSSEALGGTGALYIFLRKRV